MGRNNISKIIWDIINYPERESEILNSLSDEELSLIQKHFQNIKNQPLQSEPKWIDMWDVIQSKAYTKKSKYSLFYNSIKYAAAVIVFASISYITYWGINKTFVDKHEVTVLDTKPIEPGTKSASLLLANGEIIDLSKVKSGKILEDSEVVISNDSTDILAYKSKEIVFTKLEYNTVRVPRAGEYSVKLSDGTIVLLNSETELKYPVNFNKKERRVFLKGEAYFEVKKDVNKPFRVQLDDMTVEVLGTSFNINSYEENKEVNTTLVEGMVKVFENNNKANSIMLKPRQQASFRNKKLSKKNVDIAEFVSWKDGKFYFNDMTLEKVMIQMERWYNIDVFYMNKRMKNYPFTGVINRMKSANEMFKIIEKVTGVKIRQKGQIIYIE